MSVQPTPSHWFILRWQHCYQWKNLLDAEREARRSLEEQHQQQYKEKELSPCNSGLLLVRNQLAELNRLRQEHWQKRFLLRDRQANEMTALKEQMVQAGIGYEFDRFNELSAVRRL